jgi:hypothetical protein
MNTQAGVEIPSLEKFVAELTLSLTILFLPEIWRTDQVLLPTRGRGPGRIPNIGLIM